MRFSVKSVSTGKLYFAVWSGSIQSPYNLADLSKIHPIVRFDTWNIPIHLTDPTYPADAAWSQLSKKRIISDQGYVRLEKIAAACDEPARNWDLGQKIGIFQSNLLHRALIQNRPKTVKNVDFSDRTRFFENIPRAECSSHRQASKTPQFGVVYPDISIRNLFKTDPPRF